MPDLRSSIQSALAAFSEKHLKEAAIEFFGTLGYTSDRTANWELKTFLDLAAKAFKPLSAGDKEAFRKLSSLHLLFQITDAELTVQSALFTDHSIVENTRIESYLFFAAELPRDRYSRTDLAALIRAINKPLPMPALVLFRHGGSVSIGIIHRRLHKRDDDKDVLEKVTLIKDIQIEQPHRAHLEILHDLSLPTLRSSQPNEEEISNFVALHRAWQKTLDVQTLNRRFFIEIRNWFYWARNYARFPAGALKDADGRDSESVIRLLTRLIFCWFLREKGLLNGDLFTVNKVRLLLRDWQPEGCDADKTGRYYKAILQNLFFATLATPVGERKFRSARNYKGRNKHYGDQRYFRHVSLFNEKAPVEELYKTIPFLNGGLFENLDEFPGPDNDLTEEVRVDGFSDTEKDAKGNPKQPFVPDFLFFGAERSVPEIAVLLGESTAPKARGLLHIFRDYKFTIEENTPLEQDIALDPELLGRAFENLLASVNPETGTVARKSTGSFYTPREIVHYMVEEALVRYLLGALAPDGASEDLDQKIRELVSEEQPSHRLNSREAERVVNLISQLHILDPACGSGAFPMGLLQLLVIVLRKLDPKNKLWEAAKLAALPPEMREKMQQVFREESWDYTRKLELIKDCIHGVDIQPTAIQIAKLRFFLSLVIEQSDSGTVRPLPNLETKFVCANALLGLPRPDGFELFQHQIEPKERALLATRSRYFFAQTDKEKEACKIEDRRLRRELSDFIKDMGGSSAEHLASAVAAWDPYHSDRRADYFDPESMFGIRDGFDITIGNPPYVRADEPSDWNRFQRGQILSSREYETLWEKWDLYIPFIERGYKLLRPGGVTTMIVSDAFCHAKYAQKSQNWFLKHSRVLRLDFCSEVKIFTAAVHNIIYFFQKADGTSWKPDRRVHHQTFGEVTELPTDEQTKLTYRAFFVDSHIGSPAFARLCIALGDICYLNEGMHINAHERIAQGSFKLRDLVSETQDKIHTKRFAEGKNVRRWFRESHTWLEWGTSRAPAHFRRPTFPELYEQPEKILAVKVGEIRAAFDDERLYSNEGIYLTVPWHFLHGVRNNSLKKFARYRGEKPPRPDLPMREDLEATSRRFAVKFLLGVMNSSTACDFLRANRRSNVQLYADDWKKLPIPDVPSEKQQPVVQVVDIILSLLRHFKAYPNHRTARDTVLLEFLEDLNDALVRELYFPDELHARNLHFGRLVTEAKLPPITVIRDSAHLNEVRKSLESVYDIKSPLRAALFDLASLNISDQNAADV